MIQYGGAVVKDPQNGDYTVVLNSSQSKAALDQFIKLETTCGGPSPGAMGQTEAVQLLATGKAVQSQLVLATWAKLAGSEEIGRRRQARSRTAAASGARQAGRGDSAIGFTRYRKARRRPSSVPRSPSHGGS